MAFTVFSPMDVVFSFDTTGSMSQALDEVKARVNDIIQRIQADIPGLKVGIIAHGDYCDAEHFYDIRSLDLSDSLADVVTFVNETNGTGGGDVPECYELALQHAKNMSWRNGSRRVLVMIGDAYPHEEDYPMNVQKINWRRELSELAAQNVRIYGVQVQNDELSTQFFNQLTSTTDGQHLLLSNMGNICKVIMGICYREQGPVMFQNFEAEVRHKEAESFDPDLECVFGTLRHEVSRTSDLTMILDRDDDEVDVGDVNVDSDVTESGDASTNENVRSRLKRVRFHDSDSEEDDADEYTVPAKKRRVAPVTQSTEIIHQKTRRKVLPAARKLKNLINEHNPTPVTTGSSKAKLSNSPKHKPYREHVASCRFKCNSLRWSPWQLAACPEYEMKKGQEGKWKKVLPSCDFYESSMWRTDLFSDISQHRQQSCRMMIEMSVMAPNTHRRKVVSYHVTRRDNEARWGNGVFRLPWYRGVFRRVRPMVNRAASHKCKIYVRWARVTPRYLEMCSAVGKEYDYPWKKQLHTGQEVRPCF